MPYTVRLCRDASGWFATASAVPEQLIRWSSEPLTEREGLVVLDAANDWAAKLRESERGGAHASRTG